MPLVAAGKALAGGSLLDRSTGPGVAGLRRGRHGRASPRGGGSSASHVRSVHWARGQGARRDAARLLGRDHRSRHEPGARRRHKRTGHARTDSCQGAYSMIRYAGIIMQCMMAGMARSCPTQTARCRHVRCDRRGSPPGAARPIWQAQPSASYGTLP